VLAGAVCLPRLGSLRILIGSIALTIVATVALPSILSNGTPGKGIVEVAMLLAGFGGGMSTSTIYALAAMAYPATYRSTGIGICVGLSRGGGICSVLSGGVVLELSGAGGGVFFSVIACFLVTGLIGLTTMDRHISTRVVAHRVSV
jgi:MFS transporter, AAHS family, 4-hydroxybenzoate transporter